MMEAERKQLVKKVENEGKTSQMLVVISVQHLHSVLSTVLLTCMPYCYTQ